MGLDSVIADLGARALGHAVQAQSEAPLPTDVEELEDECHRWKLRLQSVEEEGVFPPRRFIYAGAAFVAGIVIYAWLVRK